MEICDKELPNNSTSNSEEKQSESFNSSELNDAMDELTHDIQESKNNSNEEDLLDMMEEKSVAKHAMQKLKFYTANKIIRRAKYLKKKNYYFLANTGINPENLLRIKTSESLKKLDEKTSQKIRKVINSGDLTVQRLNSFKNGFEPPLISKTKFITPSSILNASPYESGESSLAPESFPKAIVYPDTTKLNIQSIKAIDRAKMSFNEVFTKAAEEIVKYQISIDNKKSKADSTNKPQPRVLTPRQKGSNKIETIDLETESNKKESFKYLIPQNLLASQSDNTSTNSNLNDSNASTSKSHSDSASSDENLDYTHSVIPERPKINYELIDALADYRVIAKYLFNKLNVPPIDFDATDDYINLYKLSRN